MSTARKKPMTLAVKKRSVDPKSDSNSVEIFVAQAETLHSEQPIVEIPVKYLYPSPFQPREHFSEEQLQMLAASIKEQGIFQPIIVRRSKNPSGEYEIVAGERRWRAAQLVNIMKVPCLVRELSDEKAALISLIENTQREDLSSVEKAQGYQNLIKQHGLKQTDLGRIFGLSKSTISQTLSLLKLPPAVQKLIRERSLDGAVAMELLALRGTKAAGIQEALAEKASKLGWNLQQLRRAVKAINVGGKEPPTAMSQDMVDLSDKLIEHLGVAVQIKTANDEQGRIIINYNSKESLKTILNRMGLVDLELL